jgi:predicted negative regulator of RcsB-dependent stress response
MAYDLEEQEQIDAVKAWWNDNGTLVMLVVIAALLTIAGFQGWRYYRAQQSGNAATLYLQLEQADRANDPKKVRDIAKEVIDRYGSTPYATMAALAAAKASFTTGELEEAKKRLEWAIEHARDDEARDIARLRLAAVLLDEKKFDDALTTLSAKHLDAYDALFADLRGDVLAAQGKIGDARAAYQQALDKSDAASGYRRLVEVKLDALGEAK